MAASKAKLIASFLAGAAIAALAMFAHKYSGDSKMPLVHKLEYPLLLSGGAPSNQHHFLPKGTSLYFDQAFPEGFVRYKVYVNVEGAKLESKESTEQFWLDPLTAFPVDAANLKKILKEYPLTKEDLADILKSGNLQKEEIREILAEYSK